MRITRDLLMKLAQDTVAQKVRSDRSVVGVYLHGSLLTDEPLLGGTTDIDLFFVHDDEPGVAREIVRITDDIHLDIAHAARKFYRQARDLRLHPWFGPTLYGCKILYDPQHYLDFVQASVRGQFERPDRVMERVRPLLDQARQIWLSFPLGSSGSDSPQSVILFLKALESVAQAIALLSGPTLTERRFLLQFSGRVNAIQKPGLYAGMLGLLHGMAVLDVETLGVWVSQWRSAFVQVANGNPPERFVGPRIGYYGRAFEALIDREAFQDVLWPLLNTWSRLAALLSPESESVSAWRQAFMVLGLIGDAFADRLAALDAYLDTIEELLEAWARENGA